MQIRGEAFVSNAVLDGKFTLRACIIDFRTSIEDIRSLPESGLRTGQKVDAELRPEMLKVGE